jgi:hypothetical protein
MKLPDEFELKIGSVYWTVRLIDGPVDAADDWGFCDFERLLIVVSRRGSVLANLCHELDHVFGSVCSYDTSSKEGHKATDRRGHAHASFLVDNREILRGLIGQQSGCSCQKYSPKQEAAQPPTQANSSPSTQDG